MFSTDELYNIEFQIFEKVFKKELPSKGYTYREAQVNMSEEIVKLLHEKKKVLVIEAGVGTGKSFAYLIPLLILQKEYRWGFSILISTGTIALQEQLRKDIEKLKTILKLNTKHTLAKGASHFICLNKLNKEYSGKNQPEWLGNWNESSYFGDRAELEELIPDIEEIWPKINVQKCTYQKCNYFNDCKFIDLRKEMKKENNIIITNHDQLIANAKNISNYKSALFPSDIQLIVIDEAHNFEEKTRSSLTLMYKENDIFHLIKRMDNILQNSDNFREYTKKYQEIKSLFLTLFHEFKRDCNLQVKDFKSKGLESQRFELKLSAKIEETMMLLKENLISYSNSLEIVENTVNVPEELYEETYELIELIDSIVGGENKIYWLEQNNKNMISINSTPKNIDEEVKKYFFEIYQKPVIFTSATISQHGEDNFESYEFFLTELGLDSLPDKYLTMVSPKASPFNYKENSLLYIPSSLPHPKDKDSYNEEAIQEILKLVNLTEGRAMILFTAKSDMNLVYDSLQLFKLPGKVLVQKPGSSTAELKKDFMEDENSILLCTGSFWEGIDIPGPTLSNLIVYKLPFAVPDPINNYKASKVNNPMSEVYLPQMIIKLKQGIGRLIRKESDTGIVSILDSRLSEKVNSPYRHKVLASLPLPNVTESFEELKKFVDKKILK